jgi:leucyl-tRNA synthetase
MYERGLAYEAEMPVNYCSSCQAVLADEESEGSKCFRCGSDIERKNIKQWMLRITDYAERLLKDLDLLEWPEKIKAMQKN